MLFSLKVEVEWFAESCDERLNSLGAGSCRRLGVDFHHDFAQHESHLEGRHDLDGAELIQ